jgi:hypothetical protein
MHLDVVCVYFLADARSFPYLIAAAKERLESVTKKPINTVEASYSEQQAARAQVRSRSLSFAQTM